MSNWEWGQEYVPSQQSEVDPVDHECLRCGTWWPIDVPQCQHCGGTEWGAEQ